LNLLIIDEIVKFKFKKGINDYLKIMSEEKIPLFARRASGLVREIGPLGLIAMCMSYAIGGGINLLSIKNGYLYPGSNVGLAFALAGIPVILVSVCYALLAITMPRSGGAYVFISRTISPTLGFLASWISWFGGWMLCGIIAYYDAFFWGTMLWNVGAAFRNVGVMSFATWIMQPVNSLWVGIILLALAFLVCSLRISTVVRIIEVLWIIPLIGSITMMIVYGMNWGLASISPERFKSIWDSVMGAGSYDEVMSIALAHGFDPAKWTTFSWDATWSVAAYAAIFAYGSPATPPTAVAGEVKTPTKSQIIGTVGGCILIAIYYVLVSSLCYGACDPFIRAYAFNYYKGYSSAYKITPNLTPSLPLMAGILSQNFGLAALFAASAAIWLWNDMPSFILYMSRFIFAWAFDRSFPEVFAKVHPTLRSPIYANILNFILSVLACVMCWGWWIYGIFTLLDNVAVWAWIFPDMFVGLACAALPLIRPEIYKESPTHAWRFLGCPLEYIFGVLGFAGMGLFVWLVTGTLTPGGTPTPDIMLITVMLAIGLLISMIYQHRAAKKGIPVSDIFKAIPPA